jgi:hypothetical protein
MAGPSWVHGGWRSSWTVVGVGFRGRRDWSGRRAGQVASGHCLVGVGWVEEKTPAVVRAS